MPARVPGMPHCLEAAMMGAMKAKLDPKKMGTLPFVTRWKMRVPKPAVNKAVAGLSPTSKGTKTVAPNATKRNCTPTIPFLKGVNRMESIIVFYRLYAIRKPPAQWAEQGCQSFFGRKSVTSRPKDFSSLTSVLLTCSRPGSAKTRIVSMLPNLRLKSACVRSYS